jgi:transposase
MAVAGDNPERLCNEAALAALCDVSPLQASPRKTMRHRLNRAGHRSANNALWTIALRMRSAPRTRAYVDCRTQEGMSGKEIHCCLERYIARELYPIILAYLADSRCISCHRSVNAAIKKFFKTLKVERIYQGRYQTGE